MSAVPIPPIEELLPHRGTMLLLDAVLAYDEESVTATASVQPRAWYAEDDGTMPSWVGIELMAQAIAAHVGLLALCQGRPPKQGVLLGTRAYHAAVPCFPARSVIVIKASVAFRDVSGMGAYDCTLLLNGQVAATATVKVFEPGDFNDFLAQTSI